MLYNTQDFIFIIALTDSLECNEMTGACLNVFDHFVRLAL